MLSCFIDLGVTPGSQTFSSSGTFTVPAYNTLSVTITGSGGGGGSAAHFGGDGETVMPGVSGGNAGSSKFDFGDTPPTAGGGKGGEGGGTAGGADGDPGTAAGGDTNTVGGGASGGAGGTSELGNGGDGGDGGYVVKSYTSATGPSVGTSISVTVGSKGNGAALEGDGTKGSVVIAWS